MREKTKIEWCHHTFNPWRGCARVSDGCINCHAERLAKRNPALLGEWGPGRRIIASENYWQQPLRWDKYARRLMERHRVFCGSMMDICEVLDQHQSRAQVETARARLLDLVKHTPNLDWLLLTKRPENANHLFRQWWQSGWPQNVWMGATAENQEMADVRIPVLLAVPATKRFLSLEPLLGPIDLGYFVDRELIGWVIVGGESGAKARPIHPDWVRSIRDQCRKAGVPFFFKQWGAWMPGTIGGGRDTRTRALYPDGRLELDMGQAHLDAMELCARNQSAHIS